MPTTPKQFGFIRTTLALWAVNVGSFIRAGVVSDSPNGGNAWGVNVPGFGWLYAAMRGAHESFASVAATNLTSGKYPKAGVGGELGDSSLSEDAAGLKAAKSLTLANATRLPWQSGHQALQIDTISAIWQAGGGTRYARGIYFDGSVFKFANSTDIPVMITLTPSGGIDISTSLLTPVINTTITDIAARLKISKEGGLGFYGVAAPTPRPTVNAACTDLATVVALTNQLRTHLIACGLVQ